MRMKLIYLLLPVLLVSMLILGAGCMSVPNFNVSFVSLPKTSQPSSATSIPAEPTLSSAAADMIDNILPSVVAIDADISTSDSSGRPVTEQVAGSGWILDPGGLIVTNNHVVEGAKSVTVTLENGQTYISKAIYTDPINDLAVVDIGIHSLPGITLGNSSKIKVGDQVIAIGNALGEEIRATQGIISSTNSTFTVENRETLNNMLETTALIAYGDSGGPLLNMDGQVIGIITGASMTRYGSEVAGYAISSNTALPIIQQLTNNNSVTH